MKISKKLLTSSVAAIVASMGLSATAGAAEVVATAAVANMYLWRGQDLGYGDPAVSGDIKVTESGFTVGAWGSSGDATNGTEYDLWAGYGGSSGDFRYDLTFWTYVYPSAGGNDDTDNIGDLSEVVLTLGFGPVTFMYYDNIANKNGNNDYTYYTLSGTFGAFTALVGYADFKTDLYEDESDPTLRTGVSKSLDYTHIDVSYAYNENVTFTLSQVVDESPKELVDNDLKFVVKYSLPIK